MDLFGESPPQESTEAIHGNAGISPEEEHHVCLGHQDAESRLLAFCKSGKIPHSIAFTGPKGIGKAKMAYRFASFLLKHGARNAAQEALFEHNELDFKTLDIPLDDPVARRVKSGGHADLKIIERPLDADGNSRKNNIDVGEIRKIPSFLRMTAGEGGWRIVIVDDADNMNRNAQNALLKNLEEPPENTLIMLIIHNMGALLPTIRSRVQLLPFKPLPPEIIKQLMTSHGLTGTETEQEILMHMAEGSFGKVLELAERDGLDVMKSITDSFGAYPRLDWPNLHRLADELGRRGKESQFNVFQEIMQWVFYRLATLKARGRPLSDLGLQTESFEAFFKNSSLTRLLDICEKLQGHFILTNRSNLDNRQGVLGAFSLINDTH